MQWSWTGGPQIMNYIRHMNAFFSYVKADTRLTSSHVSLYMALFQYWNFNRFQNPFPVYRDNIMQLSKIGSKNTYHKCVKDLRLAGYIFCHTPVSKFHRIKISIIKLDMKEEKTDSKQLNVFDSENKNTPCTENDTLRCPKNGTPSCPKIDTDSVPYLTATCPTFDTVPVPNVGHNIKHKHSYKRESKTLSQKIFDKNEKINLEINNLGRVPNSVHGCHPERSKGSLPPDLTQVQEFFTQNNYPDQEARKFFNHYKAIGWKIKGITPIEDWQAAAHKWMLNAGKFEDKKQDQLPATANSIESLFKLFLAGQNIFQQLTPEHFKELNLELTEAVLSHAWQQRINQLTGSNQRPILQLLQAYQDNRENDPLLITDKDNLISLAKRIAILNHFQQLKLSGATSLSC